MTTLAEHIAAQLAEEDVEVSSEQIQSHIDSYEEPAPKGKAAPKATAKGKAAPKGKAPAAKAVAKGKKASTKTSDEEEEHTCERTIGGKEGSRICGKKAKNELNDMWFCGTEKSGCYKSALGKAATAPKTKAKVVPAKGSAKGKAAGVVQKVVKKERISLTEVPSGSGIWVDLNNFRTVYSQDPKEAYGILDEDDETILPLTEEAVAFAEAHGLPIRKKTTKTTAKPVPKGKAVAKAGGKPAPKGKTAPIKAVPKGKAVAPKGKVAPKAKSSKKAPQDDDELLEELQQEADDVEVEPDVEEEGEVPAEEEEDPEIDLGEADDAGEEVEEDDAPDVEEVDEGEAAEEEDVEEDVADEEDDE